MAEVLKLGEVAFSDFEVPEHFAIGGSQRLVIHTLPGGGRVVDAMGAEDKPIHWSGFFSGQGAAERTRVLEGMRRDGRSRPLTWSAWRYDVIVQEFEAQIARSWWIPYRIQLCITSTDRVAPTDWLDRAKRPTLDVELTTTLALESAIAVANQNLLSADLGQAIGAARNLAQYETARLYGFLSS